MYHGIVCHAVGKPFYEIHLLLENYVCRLGCYQVNHVTAWTSMLKQIFYNQEYACLVIYTDV